MQSVTSSQKIQFNPFLPDFQKNPYPFYHQLREEDPIHKSFLGVWILTRYNDVKSILRDSRFRADEVPQQIKAKNQYAKDSESFLTLANVTSKWIFFLDPPDHTRIRNLLTKAFSTTIIENMLPSIQETINGLLDKIQHKHHIDIIADFACPLPVITIAKMLGVPAQDHELLNQWSTCLSRILDPLLPLELYNEMDNIAKKFKDYLRDLIKDRKKQPKNDLISSLLAAQEQKSSFSEDELLATCMVLFISGEETVVNLIGNGTLALLNHPEQMLKLKNDFSLIKNAIEELLRYDSPLQQTARIASENIEIGGKIIQTGEKVLLSLGAANRDPAQFPNPDKVDITREHIQHVGFGGGIHNCLGITLARIQARIAIESLIHRFPLMRLASKNLEWDPHIALRRLKSLPIHLI